MTATSRALVGLVRPQRRAPTSYSRGEAMFRGECGSCHTMYGYRAMRNLMDGRDRASIRNFVVMLHDYKPDTPYHKFMPPMTGTTQDIDDLTNYLNAKVNPPAPSKPKPLMTAQR